jgi:GNAT superfamily N-acetyltransferase
VNRKFILNGTHAEVTHLYTDFSCINGLYTRPAERGKGQARRVMELILEEADAEERELYLAVEPQSMPQEKLARFYRSLGFIPAMELSTYHWRKLRKTIGPCYRVDIMFRPVKGVIPAVKG